MPDHPLINEVMKDVLTEAMDIEGLTSLLDRMLNGKIRCVAVDTPVPSQFSHEIINAAPYSFLDDAPLEERRARAVEMRRVLPDNLKDMAALEPAALKQVADEAWPDLRDCDELHDLLQTLVAIPERLSVNVDALRDSSRIEQVNQNGNDLNYRAGNDRDDRISGWKNYLSELIAKKRAARVIANERLFG